MKTKFSEVFKNKVIEKGFKEANVIWNARTPGLASSTIEITKYTDLVHLSLTHFFGSQYVWTFDKDNGNGEYFILLDEASE